MNEILTFRGYVVKYGFSNDAGWGTGTFASEDNLKQHMSIKGSITSMDKKTLYEITGYFEEHPRYGKSFNVQTYRKAPIHSTKEQVKFLAGPAFPGVGDKTAEIIINHLGDKAITKLVKDINLLNEIPGLNPIYIPIIKKGIEENIRQEGQERLRYIFFENNLKTSILDWMDNHFDQDNDIIENIFSNSFLSFAKDKEIASFDELDKVAVHFGLELHSPERIAYWAWKLADDFLFSSGDSYTNKDYLSRSLMRKLKIQDTELLFEGILYAKEKGILKLTKNRIYTEESWGEEQIIADNIIKLNIPTKNVNKEGISWEIDQIEQEIAYENKIKDFKFDEKQREALELFANNKLSIITGGPGTGKTTLIKGIVKLFNRMSGTEDYAIATPTGRAAARIRETYKKSYATTIHKLLEAKELNKFQITQNNPLNQKLVILDECSMIDNKLFASFIQSCDRVRKVVLVGDANQLPSVGYGNTFADLLELDFLKTIKLDTVHRQKNGNGIVDLAYKVLNETLEISDLESMSNVEINFDYNNQNTMNKVTELVGQHWDELEKKANHLQVICPMYGGSLGIDEINAQIQNEFNKNVKDKKKVYDRGDYRFVVDDKIMFLKNDTDLDLANGDVGKIIKINYNAVGKLKDVLTEFNDKEILLQPKNFSDVKLSYATSVHKTQGSEYNNVLLVIDNPKYNSGFINKTLIYTAVTRAKDKIVILGDSDLFFNAIKITPPRRNTTLIEAILEKREING
ncbi:exodeoxyribonuclease V subunit alpha [Mesoplasma entomophilum]|uniref:SF1B family DNA helicase RecD2 n=1 Tax=Mesoplasma entomophilum TaxID=2149 RepID=UPI000D02A6E2|nr:AAA family ATPase [Mesoplasma entomophilum]AVN60333.1 exodeoxyribonuclease V subunit alpha [Mesoplasma entomophilum]